MDGIPIETIHLFPELDRLLIQLLRSLSTEEWDQPTIAGAWTVKDVAAHLLDGNIRTISSDRDHHSLRPAGNIESNDNLVNYLNRINADWVTAMKRVSPALLTDLLEQTGPLYHQQLALRDPMAPAPFPVSWAGDIVSLNWFNTAREFTEKWHHQQQIRDAVNQQAILNNQFYYPVLDTFMYALPYTFRNTNAPLETLVKITISGNGGGDWFLIKKDQWKLIKQSEQKPKAHTTIDGSVAWKLFTKSRRSKDIMSYVTIEGERLLGEKVLDMISVMA